MRIISTIVATLALFAVISTPKASADIMNTNINTKISNEINTYTIQNDPFLIRYGLYSLSGMINSEKMAAPEKTEADIKYEQTLEKWKVKQQHLWNNLPTEPFTINASAYTAAADECGKSDGITASGVKVQEKRTLACPQMYPFGTKISIEGYGVFTCEDRGGAIKGNHFDIYTETKTEAFAFGRRHLLAQVVQ
ncbi:MAG: 3D domain-containing protein [Candidatus Moranbacteria bacterium]|nr:3D domain-containing protein [Candidatus Moranbacteria bacterium]